VGVPTSEVGYTSATTGRGDHEVHKGHVVALEIKEKEKRKKFELSEDVGQASCFSTALPRKF
jgi:hypothetical protein